MITEKQKRFCEEYLVDLNATQAAVRCGYSKKTANEQGARMLANVSIQDYIGELREKQMKRTELSADIIINELKALGFWSIKDFLETDNSVKDLSQMDKAILKPVVGIKVIERTVPGQKKGQVEKYVTTELKFVDKRATLVDLGRHVGIFEKDNNQKKIKIKVTRK